MIKINTRRGGGSLEYWIKVLAFCLLLFTFCIFETPGSVKSTLSSSSYNAVWNTFKYWRSYWHIWYTVPEHSQAGGSLVFSLNRVLNAYQRTTPSASLLNLYLRQATFRSAPFILFLKEAVVSPATTHTALTLLANILHSRHQLLFQELALFCNFVSFLQEILCCLFNGSSQNMGLFRTPSLFIRGALVASVNQCCYLKA